MDSTFKYEGGKTLYTNKEMLELLRVNNATLKKYRDGEYLGYSKDRRQVLLLNVGHTGFPEEHTQRTLSVQLTTTKRAAGYF